MRKVVRPVPWEFIISAPAQPDPQALARGRARKRWNAVAAILSGALPALILIHDFPIPWEKWVIGFLAGLVWANGFEYLYHRYLLHLPRNFLSLGHLQHHSSVGTPQEPDHVNLGSSPLWVVVLFVINEALVIAFDLPLHLGIAPGMFLGFVAYQVLVEEFHWRIHLGGWLPPGLRWTREYHLAHHDRPDGRFNIFLPLFDAVFGFPMFLKRTRPASVFAIAPGTGSRLTVAEKSMLVWLFTLAVAANLFSSGSLLKMGESRSVQQTRQAD
jgi:Fatty acid hydroxylase superfamily